MTVQVVAADLSTDDDAVADAELCASRPLTMLVNNAGVAHFMPIAELSAAQARELVHRGSAAGVSPNITDSAVSA